MLIQFNFTNFKSFKNNAILDLSATKITEHSNRIVSVGKEKILRAAAIFGANASGKSNVYEAFEFMTYYVSESFKFGGESDGKTSNKDFYLKVTPFMFDNTSKNTESLFEVYFTNDFDYSEKIYKYGFCIDTNGITEEWLSSKSKTSTNFKRVFYRNNKKNELDLSGIPYKSRENIEISLEKETLIVSLGSKLKITKLKMIRDWFMAIEFASFGNPIENLYRSQFVPKNFVDSIEVQNDVINYFSSFDDSIKGFNVEKNVQESDKEEKTLKIDALHKNIDSNELISIPLSDESDGTLKMFALYPSIQDVLKNGGVLFVDELNARLHPLLVRNIIITFLNPEINVKNGQLIFTTHDTWQLSNDLLRRDEIWFVEKNIEGISSIYSLADFVDEEGFKIRKDENYEKNYLLGKYGAIPSLKGIDIFMEK